MAGEKLHTDIDALSERLQDGIETCRSVVANYRALLSDEQLVAGGPVTGQVTDGEQPPNGCDDQNERSLEGATAPESGKVGPAVQADSGGGDSTGV